MKTNSSSTESPDTRCEACKKQIKTWNGGDPNCGFTSGHFTEDNWCCATVRQIRFLANRQGLKEIPGIQFTACESEQRYATIDLSKVDALWVEGGGAPISLYVGWYKNRGRTECMWLMFETKPPRAPTEAECLAIVEAYHRLYGPFKIQNSSISGSFAKLQKEDDD